MGLCQVALITAFLVLLQCGLQHAASCKNRKTVIQIRISGKAKTNIKVTFPPKPGPVKFDPFPYPNKEGKYNADCFICNGPSCQKCTNNEDRSPSSLIPQENTPLRTNIVIDLSQFISDSQKQPQNKTPPPTSQDGTVVVVQDSTSASSASNSASSDSGSSGAQTAASSATSAAISDSDIIASFDQPTSGNESTGNTEDIFVQDDSSSVAGSAAISNVENKQTPVSNNKTPGSQTTTNSASANKEIAKTGNSANSNLAISESSTKSNAENTSSNGDNATSSAGGVSAGAAGIDEETSAAEVVVRATSSVAYGVESEKGSDTVTTLSQAATFDNLE